MKRSVRFLPDHPISPPRDIRVPVGEHVPVASKACVSPSGRHSRTSEYLDAPRPSLTPARSSVVRSPVGQRHIAPSDSPEGPAASPVMASRRPPLVFHRAMVSSKNPPSVPGCYTTRSSVTDAASEALLSDDSDARSDSSLSIPGHSLNLSQSALSLVYSRMFLETDPSKTVLFRKSKSPEPLHVDPHASFHAVASRPTQTEQTYEPSSITDADFPRPRILDKTRVIPSRTSHAPSGRIIPVESCSVSLGHNVLNPPSFPAGSNLVLTTPRPPPRAARKTSPPLVLSPLSSFKVSEESHASRGSPRRELLFSGSQSTQPSAPSARAFEMHSSYIRKAKIESVRACAPLLQESKRRIAHAKALLVEWDSHRQHGKQLPAALDVRGFGSHIRRLKNSGATAQPVRRLSVKTLEAEERCRAVAKVFICQLRLSARRTQAIVCVLDEAQADLSHQLMRNAFFSMKHAVAHCAKLSAVAQQAVVVHAFYHLGHYFNIWRRRIADRRLADGYQIKRTLACAFLHWSGSWRRRHHARSQESLAMAFQIQSLLRRALMGWRRWMSRELTIKVNLASAATSQRGLLFTRPPSGNVMSVVRDMESLVVPFLAPPHEHSPRPLVVSIDVDMAILRLVSDLPQPTQPLESRTLMQQATSFYVRKLTWQCMCRWRASFLKSKVACHLSDLKTLSKCRSILLTWRDWSRNVVRAQAEFAESRNRSMTARSFYRWKHISMALFEAEQTLGERGFRRIMLRKYFSRLRLIVSAKSDLLCHAYRLQMAARERRLRKVLARWLQYAKRSTYYRKAHAVVQSLYLENLLVRFWRQLSIVHCRRQLLRRVFGLASLFWEFRSSRYGFDVERADLLSRYLKNWKRFAQNSERARVSNLQDDICDKIYRLYVIRSAFTTWRRMHMQAITVQRYSSIRFARLQVKIMRTWCDFCHRRRALIDHINGKTLLRQTFRRWQRELVLLRRAQFGLCRLTFRRWASHTKQTVHYLPQAICARIVQRRCMRQWRKMLLWSLMVREFRARMTFQRARGCLLSWATYTRYRVDKLRQRSRFFVLQIRKVAIHALQKLRKYCYMRKLKRHQLAMAQSFLSSCLTARSLFRWKKSYSSLIRLKQLSQKADEFYMGKLLQRQQGRDVGSSVISLERACQYVNRLPQSEVPFSFITSQARASSFGDVLKAFKRLRYSVQRSKRERLILTKIERRRRLSVVSRCFLIWLRKSHQARRSRPASSYYGLLKHER